MAIPFDKNRVVEIRYGDRNYRTAFEIPRQDIPEKDKTPYWFLKNIEYGMYHYNRPIGNYNFSAVIPSDQGDRYYDGSERPVQFMLRMMLYYMGKQPNLDYNHIVPNIGQDNKQAQWIKGNEVSEFVNYFRGLIMQRITNCKYTAKPVSKSSQSRREAMMMKMMIEYELRNILKESGVQFDPAGGKQFDSPEAMQEYLDTEFTPKERLAVLGTDLANGIWFSNNWISKALQMFMHTVITSNCAMEHYIENGMTYQRVRMPHQLIIDNRVDNDYGFYDEFIGTIDCMTPVEIFTKFPQLNATQRATIELNASKNKLGLPYNNICSYGTPNILWWNYGINSADNTVTVVNYYWQTKHWLDEKVPANATTVERNKRKINDILGVSLIGNEFLTNMGYIDNVVEHISDKSKPMFPVIRFRPNTFMGESVSEVARVHKIQDKMDQYQFKMDEMIGRAKGKIPIIDSAYFKDVPQEFFDQLAANGIIIDVPSGEGNDVKGDNKKVHILDMTLDPGIRELANLYLQKKDQMGKVLSTSDASLGQNTSYIGLGVQQNQINQNTLGVGYLLDGFMDFLVINMRYACNQIKNVKTIKQRDQLALLVGDRGIAYLDFMKEDRFEEFFIELRINDIFDAKDKTELNVWIMTYLQNAQYPEAAEAFLQALKVRAANSNTEATEIFQRFVKDSKKRAAEKAAAEVEAQTQSAGQLLTAEKMFDAKLQQEKDLHADYRTEVTATMSALSKMHGDIEKQYTTIIQTMAKLAPVSPLEQDTATASQPAQ